MKYSDEQLKNLRKDAVKTLLISVGEDPDREGLQDTPRRVAKMYDEVFAGYKQDPISILRSAVFQDEHHDELVIVKDIEYWSHCEHHMVPFFGRVHIGYIPRGNVVGLSKFGRLVDALARRLQVQERLTSQIADAIVEALDPLGVAVVVEGRHLCMAMRGVKKPDSFTTTSAMRGVFRDNQNNARAEFLSLIKQQ